MSISDKARKFPASPLSRAPSPAPSPPSRTSPSRTTTARPRPTSSRSSRASASASCDTIDAYERKHENRATITDKIAKLIGEEPWSGYDEQSVDAITTALRDADQDTARSVRAYERERKDRAGVVQAAAQRIGG